VLQIPGRDEWYIVYHRISKDYLLPTPNGPGFHRQVCIDRMEFNPDGTIRRVVPTQEGVLPLKKLKAPHKMKSGPKDKKGKPGHKKGGKDKKKGDSKDKNKKKTSHEHKHKKKN